MTTPAHALDDSQAPEHFTMLAVFRVSSSHPVVFDGGDVPTIVRELEDITVELRDQGVSIRGWYDVSGFRADADLMVWLHGTAAEDLQWALRQLRRTLMFRPLIRVWSAMGLFDGNPESDHAPAFVRGVDALQWLTVSALVRSPQWYLLDPEDRRRMLIERSDAGADFTGIAGSTIAAYGLGEYEWLFPIESDSLSELADLTAALRGVEARAHVDREVPVFTGRRIEIIEIVEVLQ